MAENLYGYGEVAAFRTARPHKGLMRTRSRTVITAYGRDFKRGLSMAMVQRLRARFHVPADLLIPQPPKRGGRQAAA